MAADAEAVTKHSETEIMKRCVHFIEFEKEYVLAQNMESKERVLVVSASVTIFSKTFQT